MKIIAAVVAVLAGVAALSACAGGATPYEGLTGQQVRGMPKEEPAPPLPNLPAVEQPGS